MDDTRGGVPARAQLDAVGAGQLGDADVTGLVACETLLDLLVGHVGIEAEVGVGEIAGDGVVLRRVIVGLGLAQLAHAGGGIEIQMEMVEQGILIVEELGVHGPRAVLVHEAVTDQFGTQLGDEVLEGDLFGLPHVHVAHALIGGGIGAIHGADDRGEPPLLDGTAVGAQGEVVVGMEAEAVARLTEAAGDKGGKDVQDTVVLFKVFTDQSLFHEEFLSFYGFSREDRGVYPYPHGVLRGIKGPARPQAGCTPPAGSRRHTDGR